MIKDYAAHLLNTVDIQPPTLLLGKVSIHVHLNTTHMKLITLLNNKVCL